MRKTLRKALLILPAMALLAAACGDDSDDTGTGDSGAGASNDGELVIAVATEIAGLDPMAGAQTTATIITGNVGEGLVRGALDSAELEPSLATEWEAVDDTTWRFTLREGVEFHNGEPFNAEAVALSMERIKDPDNAFPHIGFFEAVDHVEVVDDYTVDIVTSAPTPELPRDMTYLNMVPPEHAESSATALEEEPIGTGPYQFVSSSTDSLNLERNPDYWGDQPEFQTITILSRPETNARIAALQAGEVDIAASLPFGRVDDAPQVVSSPVRENVVIVLNATQGPAEDPLVREAMVRAVDTEGIRSAILGDEYTRSAKCQLAPDGVFGHNPDLENPEYDPERARELLEEADAVGETVQITAPAGRYVQGEEVVQAVAAALEDVGLTVDLQIADEETWLDSVRGQEGVHTVTGVFLGASSDQGYSLAPINTFVREESPLNRFPHDEFPEVQGLIEEAEQEIDDDERLELLQEIAAKVCEANAGIFLYNYDNLWGAQEGIEFEPRLDSGIALATVVSD